MELLTEACFFLDDDDDNNTVVPDAPPLPAVPPPPPADATGGFLMEKNIGGLFNVFFDDEEEGVMMMMTTMMSCQKYRWFKREKGPGDKQREDDASFSSFLDGAVTSRFDGDSRRRRIERADSVNEEMKRESG